MTPVIDFATRLQTFGVLGSAFLVVLKATLILLIVRLLVSAVPRASAAARHLGITLALCGVLALPVLSMVAPAWMLPVLPARDSAPEKRQIGSTGDDQEAPSALSAAITVAKVTGVVPQSRLTAMARIAQTAKNSWQGLVLLTLLFISIFLLARMIAGMIGVRRVARRSTDVADDVALAELDRARDQLHLSREIRLLRSEDVSVPVIWGFRHPILLLPASSSEWSRERLGVVILHELAHVKRLDGITLLITKAAVAVFWFHPLMWTLEQTARRECERACDDLVLESGTKPSDYAEHLLSIAKALPQFDPFRSVTLAMTRRSQLEGRLLSILQPHVRRSSYSLRSVAAWTILSLIAIFPLASVRLVAAPAKAKEVAQKQPSVDFGPNFAEKISAENVISHYDKIKNGHGKWLESKDPETGSEFYARGMSLHQSDRYAEAIRMFEKSIAADYRKAASMYNIACGYALMNDAPNAAKWLRQAIDNGYDNYSHIARDSDLDPVRSSPQFQAVAAGVRGGVNDGAKREAIAEALTSRVQETTQKYEELRGDKTTDGNEYFKSGLDLLRLRKLDLSIDAFTKAIDHGSKESTSMYNIACAYSLKGDTRSAAQWLRKAIEQGFESRDKLENDPDIENLRNTSGFSEFAQLADDLSLNGWRSGKGWMEKWFDSDDETAWKSEVPRFRATTAKYPSLGRTWFNLGFAELQTGENASSAQSFQKAAQLGYRPATSAYNTACAYAKAGNNDAAFDWLNRARTAGFKLNHYLEDDDDLENLRADTRYRLLRQQVRAEDRKHEND